MGDEMKKNKLSKIIWTSMPYLSNSMLYKKYAECFSRKQKIINTFWPTDKEIKKAEKIAIETFLTYNEALMKVISERDIEHDSK